MPRTVLLPRVKFKRTENIESYQDEFREQFANCEQINSAKVCDSRFSFKMHYCENRKCYVLGEGDYIGDRSAYLAWYGVVPDGKGIGKKFYHELEDWLHKRRCIERVTLHAMKTAESFWTKMGFEDVDKEDEETWWQRYRDLRRMQKHLARQRSCLPEKAVGTHRGPVKEVKLHRQKTLDHYRTSRLWKDIISKE